MQIGIKSKLTTAMQSLFMGKKDNSMQLTGNIPLIFKIQTSKLTIATHSPFKIDLENSNKNM